MVNSAMLDNEILTFGSSSDPLDIRHEKQSSIFGLATITGNDMLIHSYEAVTLHLTILSSSMISR